MIYLDNAATTGAAPEVIDAMSEMLGTYYGNPSSVYDFGMEAKKRIDDARRIIADGLGAAPKEIYFTSCGSESNNLSIFGTMTGNEREEVVLTEMEHSSVKKAYERLAKDRKVITVHAEGGVLKAEDVLKEVNENTRLVSVMHVNNELGNIQPIEEIGKGIKKINPDTLFHVDGIQGFGKIPIDVNEAKIDLYSMSAHKLHGPKGVGALYIRDGVHVEPIIVGGGQEDAISSGTENTAGIVGFGVAAKKALKNIDESYERLSKLKNHLIDGLKAIDDVHILSDENSSPYITAVAVRGIKSEVLLHWLEDKEIYISTGSACHRGKKSSVTKALGLGDDYEDGVVRISFCDETTEEEVDRFLEEVRPGIEEIRDIIGGIHG